LRFDSFFRNRDNSVSFLSNAPIKAASVPIDHQKMALYRLEWEQFLCTPLPSDNDDDGALLGGQSIGHGLSGDTSFSIRKMPKSQTSVTESSSFASSPKLMSAGDPGSVSRSFNQPPSLGSIMPGGSTLMLDREQHCSDIQSGNLKRIKKILAESAADMLRDGQVAIKHEAGDTLDGYGIRVFPDSTLYAGDFLGGYRDGVGILRWSNGHSYHGQWLNDAAHGRGRYLFPNGDTYTGEWDSGSVIGDGLFTHEDGVVFDGEHRR